MRFAGYHWKSKFIVNILSFGGALKNAPFFNDQTIKPEPDLSVVPSHGDVDVTTRIAIFGISSSDSATNRVMDKTLCDGKSGIDV